MDTDDIPSPDRIKAQLETVLRSEEFLTSARLQDFLRYIVEKNLKGEQNKIKQFSIAIDVYNRPLTFEPKTDPLIRIEARRLRRALARYYENNQDASVLIDIPRGAYVPRFTWNKTSSKSESSDHTAIPFTSFSSDIPVVGVFPFEFSGEKKNAYLADGLAQELVDQLCHFPYFRVMSFSTTSHFAGMKSELQNACKSLGIDIALTGSLKFGQANIHLIFQLHDVSSGEQIWSFKKQVQSTISRIVNCEEDILNGVASRIADTCGMLNRYLAKKIDFRNQQPSTFEAILRSHYCQQNLTQENYDLATSALETAILKDPKNPTLLALLGIFYIDAEILGYADIPDAVAKGSEFASLAVTIDPNSQIAHHSNAYAAFIARNRHRVLQSAERIVEINPYAASMIATAGFWFCLCGEYERGMEWFCAGTELNPMYERWLHAAPYFYFLHKEDFSAALKHARDFEMPGFFWGHIMRVAALGLLGREGEANKEYKKLVEVKADFSTKYRYYISSFVLDEKILNRMVSGIEVARKETAENNKMAISKV